MRLNDGETEWLQSALEALDAGEGRRFQDLLWLGFGDRWTLIEAALVQQDLIICGGRERLPPRVTGLGLELLAALSPKLPTPPEPPPHNANKIRIMSAGERPRVSL